MMYLQGVYNGRGKKWCTKEKLNNSLIGKDHHLKILLNTYMHYRNNVNMCRIEDTRAAMVLFQRNKGTLGSFSADQTIRY